mmetsp:Transcript_3003/g.10577  ORF Transcript_3003/g.10577 Transcript_3003/m.10577 type:complete len:92 (-) Transcript_3003:1771-2046(-)
MSLSPHVQTKLHISRKLAQVCNLARNSAKDLAKFTSFWLKHIYLKPRIESLLNLISIWLVRKQKSTNTLVKPWSTKHCLNGVQEDLGREFE